MYRFRVCYCPVLLWMGCKGIGKTYIRVVYGLLLCIVLIARELIPASGTTDAEFVLRHLVMM